MDVGRESKVKSNVKMKMSAMLQMGMRCGRLAGHPGDQTKAAGWNGPPLDETPEDIQRRHGILVVREVNAADDRQQDEA
jgi:hypothetical protein